MGFGGWGSSGLQEYQSLIQKLMADPPTYDEERGLARIMKKAHRWIIVYVIL